MEVRRVRASVPKVASGWATAAGARHLVRPMLGSRLAQLQRQFAIERTLPETLPGLASRMQAELTAHTPGAYLSVPSGRPPLTVRPWRSPVSTIAK